MNKEEFELKLQQFLNNQVYIMAYRFNYDSARIFNDELIDYIKQLQQERNQFKEYTNHNYDKEKKYKEVIDKAINDIDLVIELIKQQPTEDDSWILGRLNAFKIILKEVE